MRAQEIMELVLSKHEKKDSSPIQLSKNISIEPKLNYSGKMAKRGYWQYRRNWHATRPFVGALDFKIMNKKGSLEHYELLSRLLGNIPMEAVREIYLGESPQELKLDPEATSIAEEIQCAFLEQEVNWGNYDFQCRTWFGFPELDNKILSSCVPRDFFMLFLEYTNSLLKEGYDKGTSLDKVVSPHRETSGIATKKVIMPPIQGSGMGRKLTLEFEEKLFRSSQASPKLWITPFLPRISKFCESIGESPYYGA